MDSYIVISFFQILAFTLVFLEIIIPSGGIISIFAIGSFSYSWYAIIEQGQSSAYMLFGLADIIALPLSIFFGFKALRKSPFINNEELSNENGYTMDTSSKIKQLLGREAIVISQLRPSGKIEVDGEMYDAISNGEMLETGSTVVIIEVAENKISVELK